MPDHSLETSNICAWADTLGQHAANCAGDPRRSLPLIPVPPPVQLIVGERRERSQETGIRSSSSTLRPIVPPTRRPAATTSAGSATLRRRAPRA